MRITFFEGARPADAVRRPPNPLTSDSAPPAQGLSSNFSVYLDLVRFLAALSVVLQHTWWQFSPADHIDFPGHEAVVFFFVLSGYVISYTASRPGMTLATYVQHRIARIVPVAWTALLIGLGLAWHKGQDALVPTLANMAFLGQSGLGWIEAPDNMAYWSLNYEVWYYAIFGAWLFAPPRYRKPLVALMMVLAGPKIVMLLPVWLMGVWLVKHMPVLGRGQAWAVFAATIVATALLWLFDVSDLIRAWFYHVCPPAWRAHHSTQVIYDLLLGVIVTAHFAAAARLAPGFAWLQRCARPIRYLAGLSFSMYAFHGPLGEVYRPGMHPIVFYTALAVGVFVLAQLTERRVGWFRRLLA
jgi:peptidoglycan/LPS O-acetylase OafA/YrhL